VSQLLTLEKLLGIVADLERRLHELEAKRDPDRPVRYLTRKKQGERYDRSEKTIERWGEDPRMAMPPEYDFNGLLARREDELEVWERTRIGRRLDSAQALAAKLARIRKAEIQKQKSSENAGARSGA
jgi:hypothetical protein